MSFPLRFLLFADGLFYFSPLLFRLFAEDRFYGGHGLCSLRREAPGRGDRAAGPEAARNVPGW